MIYSGAVPVQREAAADLFPRWLGMGQGIGTGTGE